MRAEIPDKDPIGVPFSDLEAGDLDIETFDHAAHVSVAWGALAAYPLFEAIPRFCTALRNLVEAHGAADKFNETMSVAFLLLIRERMREGESWGDFQAREAPFIAAGLGPVRADYSERQLQTPDARRRFELPDPAPRTGLRTPEV